MCKARRLYFSSWILLAAVGAAAGNACGGDDGDDGAATDAGTRADAGTDAGPALGELGGALAEALCPRMFDCCTSADLRELFQDDPPEDVPTDVASCQAAVTPALDEVAAELADAVAAGRLEYDAARMDACLRAIGERSCDGFVAVLEDMVEFSGCEPPFAPLVPEGEACTADRECTTGLCARTDEDTGSCAALPGEGEACPDARCADGSFCDDIAATCLAQKEDGQECRGEDECRSGACVDETCGASPLCDGQS